MTKAQTRASNTPTGRLHSDDPRDAAWRSQQANVDADIEGNARDGQADRLIEQMRADDIPQDEQLERIKAHFLAKRDRTKQLEKCV